MTTDMRTIMTIVEGLARSAAPYSGSPANGNPAHANAASLGSVVAEARYAGVPLLYHATDAEGAVSIIHHVAIQPRTGATVNGKTVRGISFSRSESFANAYSTVVFGLDAEGLKRRFRRRLVPYADPSIGGDTYWMDHRREAEEFLITDRPLVLTRLLRAIWISDAPQEDARHWKVAPYLRVVERHPLFAGILRTKWAPGTGTWREWEDEDEDEAFAEAEPS